MTIPKNPAAIHDSNFFYQFTWAIIELKGMLLEHYSYLIFYDRVIILKNRCIYYNRSRTTFPKRNRKVYIND